MNSNAIPGWGAMLAWSLMFGAEPLSAQDMIESVVTELVLEASGTLRARHRFEVAPGTEIRRGIRFELPDRIGPIERLEGTLDGRPIELDRDDGMIVLAAEAPLAPDRVHRLELGYSAPRALSERGDGRLRLTWTPLIRQFELPWRNASIELRWPDGRMPDKRPESGSGEESGWRIEFAGPLAAGEYANKAERLQWYWAADDWPGATVRGWGRNPGKQLLAVSVLFLLWALLHTIWYRYGRDRKKPRASESATPPDGISPAAARYVHRMDFDPHCLLAALVSLKVKRRIDLRASGNGRQLEVIRLDRPDRHEPAPEESLLENNLFLDGNEARLKPGGKSMRRVQGALSRGLAREYHDLYFHANKPQRRWIVVLTVLAVGATATVLGGELGNIADQDRMAIALALMSFGFSIVLGLVYHGLMAAPTARGAVLQGRLEGLRCYLCADKACDRPAAHFVDLLPYAVALDAEKPWRERFEGRLDTADETDEVLRWYRQVQAAHGSAAAFIPIMAGAAGGVTASGGGSAGGV